MESHFHASEIAVMAMMDDHGIPGSGMCERHALSGLPNVQKAEMQGCDGKENTGVQVQSGKKKAKKCTA